MDDSGFGAHCSHRLDFMTKLNVEKAIIEKLWTETYGQAVADQEIPAVFV